MIAFFVGIAALIICAIITSERKSLIPEKDKTLVKGVSKKAKEVSTKEPSVEAKPAPEFKNSTGLNILLYAGCFLIVAALMGYVSTVDEELIPPIVLTVTTLVFVASILIFKFVKFLKPSSYAFNVSSLIMFLFWIPSLTALGLDSNYAVLAAFFFLTGASIISAAIFKHKALWYVPGISAIGLIIACLAAIDEELYFFDALNVYGGIVSFMALGIAFRYFWKAKVTWLPVQTRHATRALSFVYPVFAAFFALAAIDEADDYPFGLTIFTILLSFYVVLPSLLTRSKSLINILRVCFEAILVTVAIDFCFSSVIGKISDSARGNIILGTVLISSFIQAFISVIFFAIKHDEESHARERFVFTAAMIGFAICSICLTYNDSYSSYYPNRDMIGDLILIAAQLSTLVFSLIALLLDKNPLMLIITAIGISDIAYTNLDSTPAVVCAILSISAVILSVVYIPLRKLDEKHALPASMVSAIFMALFALALSESESISYIPILAIGLSLAIQGFMLKKSGLRIAGVYLATLGIIIAWASAREGFSIATKSRYFHSYSYPVGVYITDILVSLVPPAAAFLLSLFDKVKPKTLKDGTVTTSFSPNFIIGFILAVFNTLVVIPSVARSDASFLGFTIALIVLIGLLIWSVAKKWIGFEITALCAILILVFENVGDNIWITMSLAGIIIIGVVVFISYKNYKKLNNKPAAIAPTAEPKPEEPKPEDKK